VWLAPIDSLSLLFSLFIYFLLLFVVAPGRAVPFVKNRKARRHAQTTGTQKDTGTLFLLFFSGW
jgi:hypothetical protein